MSDFDNTLESAGIDSANYCGILYAWLMTRRGHTTIGRNDWLTRDAAKNSLDRELRGLTACERSFVSKCYVERQEWEDGQCLTVTETWPSDLDNTLESAGIDSDTYCGILYGWYMIRTGVPTMGRGDWLTKQAAKEGLDSELRGLTERERSYVSECYVESCEWANGQGRGGETWTVDPVSGCYTVPEPEPEPVPSYVRDHPIFSKIFPGL